MAFAALVYLLVTALLFRHLLPGLTTQLFGDLGDPLLNTAILAWNAKHLPLTPTWWNFPSFAPLSGVTAFTEHFLAAYPLTTPIIWTTGNPVLAYNVLLIASITLNGVAAFALVRELTGSKTGAFIGGLAFAFAPFHAEHSTHVQMLMAFGMPFALLGLHRYLNDGRCRHLVWFAVGWLDVLLSNAYLLVFFPIFLALWAAWFVRGAPLRRWGAVAGAAAIATLPVIPLLVGYRARQTAYALTRSVEEIKALSATPWSLAGISHYAVLWKGWLPDTFYEASLFPGFAIAALALAGAVTARHRVVLFYLGAAAVMWTLTLGPDRGPYALLLQLPGAQTIRVPARAWFVATLCLAVCAGFGAAWMAGGKWRRWLVPPLAVLIAAEGWFTAPIVTVPTPLPLYLPPNALVLDLPVYSGPGNADAQYLAVIGNYRVVNGYSGYAPPHFFVLRNALADHRPEAFTPFRQREDLYVVSRPDVEVPIIEWLDHLPDAKRLVDFGKWRLYQFPRLTRGPALPLLLPLPKPGEAALTIPAD